MEFDGSIINATVISQKKRVDIKSVQIAFNKLESIQLGKIKNHQEVQLQHPNNLLWILKN